MVEYLRLHSPRPVNDYCNLILLREHKESSLKLVYSGSMPPFRESRLLVNPTAPVLSRKLNFRCSVANFLGVHELLCTIKA